MTSPWVMANSAVVCGSSGGPTGRGCRVHVNDVASPCHHCVVTVRPDGSRSTASPAAANVRPEGPIQGALASARSPVDGRSQRPTVPLPNSIVAEHEVANAGDLGQVQRDGV